MTTGRINQVARDEATTREAHRLRGAIALDRTCPHARHSTPDRHAPRALRMEASGANGRAKLAGGANPEAHQTQRRAQKRQRVESPTRPPARTQMRHAREPLTANSTGTIDADGTTTSGALSDHSRRDHQRSDSEAHHTGREAPQRTITALTRRASGREGPIRASGRRHRVPAERPRREAASSPNQRKTDRPRTSRRKSAAHSWKACPKGNHSVLKPTRDGAGNKAWPRSSSLAH